MSTAVGPQPKLSKQSTAVNFPCILLTSFSFHLFLSLYWTATLVCEIVNVNIILKKNERPDRERDPNYPHYTTLTAYIVSVDSQMWACIHGYSIHHELT